MSQNKKYYLRKIVKRFVETEKIGDWTYDRVKELLECGHSQSPKSDIYGETNAARRRCLKCPK